MARLSIASDFSSFSSTSCCSPSSSHHHLLPWTPSFQLPRIRHRFNSRPKDPIREGGRGKWRPARASISGIKIALPLTAQNDRQKVKGELLQAIKGVDRGAAASTEDQIQIDEIAKKLESLNPTNEPLQSPLVNGKWELIYTTSKSILKKDNPKLLRPWGAIYQSINADTLRAQNMETWPFFNQVTANLEPLSSRKVAVKFDTFKIGGLISIKAPGRARGELEVTYLDENLRISRGDKGNLFVLEMKDRGYRIPS